MTVDSTGRILCDWIEGDPTAPSGGRICYNWYPVSADGLGWQVRGGKLDLCPDHAGAEIDQKTGKSWRQP